MLVTRYEGKHTHTAPSEAGSPAPHASRRSAQPLASSTPVHSTHLVSCHIAADADVHSTLRTAMHSLQCHVPLKATAASKENCEGDADEMRHNPLAECRAGASLPPPHAAASALCAPTWRQMSRMQSPQGLLPGAAEPLRAPSANAPFKELHLACVLRHHTSLSARLRTRHLLPPRTETGVARDTMPCPHTGLTHGIVMQLSCHLAGKETPAPADRTTSL